ncbi:MAG: hypothetical protein J5I98_36645 [Phaeodactylibacter sp.]|nr:hypothetical protein [Phaeodactylibacter sp.]
MAVFLSTRGLSAQLEGIIKSASSEIFLVTPYLQVSDTYYERMEDAIRRGVQLTIVYGKSQLHPREEERVMELQCNLYFKERACMPSALPMRKWRSSAP